MQYLGIEYEKIKLKGSLSWFIEGFMYFNNRNFESKNFILFPDGRIDLVFKRKKNETTLVELFNIEKNAKEFKFEANTEYFIACFTLLGLEYFLSKYFQISEEKKEFILKDFIDISEDCFADLNSFSEKISTDLLSSVPAEIEPIKINLFKIIDESKGEIKVQELSKKLNWSSREINRYFSGKFGINLKMYLTIIRFRSSFNQIRNGKLYPELSYSDQSHFIREVKKISSFIPKELAQNQNDRFIQFSIFPDE